MRGRRADVATAAIDLDDLIAEVVAESDPTGEIRRVGASGLGLTTDPARLRVVLRNLVAYALHHGSPPVTISVNADGYELVVSVHDAGRGVPGELRDRVFDRFVRGDESRHGQSSGLGLSIAAENARLLGGTLTLDAGGTTFTVRLSRAVAQEMTTPASR